jgi:hypothetical protein
MQGPFVGRCGMGVLAVSRYERCQFGTPPGTLDCTSGKDRQLIKVVTVYAVEWHVGLRLTQAADQTVPNGH